MLTYLDDNLPDEIKMCFDKNLKYLKSPLKTIEEIFEKDFNLEGEDTVRRKDSTISRLRLSI